jgi:uroporphyrin-III C-methyltransferase
MYAGPVYIVGAGPGDPELLTVKAQRLLERADVILHDSLVGDAIINELPETANVCNVGKRPSGSRTSQSAINQRLVTEANRGKVVVRLKGGDPTVFGRGGEEAAYLAEHNVAFEIVPGVSSITAAPEAAGIPLTHRAVSSSLTVITGHEAVAKDDSALDWTALVRTVSTGGTLVILMGVRRLPRIVRRRTDHGLSEENPVAVIERATLPDEFRLTGTLASIAASAQETGVRSPAVVIVGEVVSIGEQVAECLGSTSVLQLARTIEPLEETVHQPP